MRKDGSFESLIYNDALYRNKQHVYDPNRINAPESWKVLPGDLKKTNQKVSTEAFPLPTHRYPFFSTPFTNSNGFFVGQRIEYENILPRCKGKLHGLEWKEVSEEDRYTARNFYIRTHNVDVAHTQHMHREDTGDHERKPWAILGYMVIFYMLFYGGLPWLNNRTCWGMNPDDSYDIGLNTNQVLATPGLAQLYGYFFIGHSYRAMQSQEQMKYPLWTEAETGIQASGLGMQHNMADYTDLAKAYPQFIGEIRDNGKVKGTPTQTFRDDHELYYDGAEGPDRIGAYNVGLWKTGGKVEKITDAYEVSSSAWFHNGPGARFQP